MVRGLAALLALGIAQAYVLAGDALPVITPPDTSLLVAGGVGLAVIVLCASLVAPISDQPALLYLIGLGGGMVVVVLNASDAGAGVTPAEAITFSALGAAFACSMLTPSLAIALPIFVALVDGASALLGGPTEVLADAGPVRPGDPLSLDVPDWGNGLSAGRLGIADVVFIGVFLAYARRYRLRPIGTAVALGIALIGALAINLELDTNIPALPLMAFAYFLVNVDRLPGLFARTPEG